MATYRFKSPDGKEYDVTAPEGATEEEAFSMLQSQLQAQPQSKPFLNPAGEGIAALGTGAVMAPLAGLAGIAGAVLPGPTGQGARIAEEVAGLSYSPRSEEAKQAMELIGIVPQAIASGTEKLGGAVTDITGSPMLGTATKTAPDAIAMLLGKRLLTKGGLRGTIPQPKPGVAEAFESGFQLTPTQAGRGEVMKMLEGLSGTAKFEKLMSQRNVEIKNSLAAKDLGLPPKTKLSDDLIDSIIAEKGASYEAVKSSAKLIKPDKKFSQDVQKLRGDFTKAAEEYPDLLKNDPVETLIASIDKPASPRAMVELTKKLRKDASTNLKSFDDPQKRELGIAQRNAATLIEDMIERALLTVGKGNLVKDWRSARTDIAKAYDIKSALNDATGEVSAMRLKKLSERGKPLSGGLEKIANFAKAFEGSARDVSHMRDMTQFSYGDLLASGLAGLGPGSTMRALAAAGGALVARPLLRRALAQKKLPGGRSPLAGGIIGSVPLLEQQDYEQYYGQ